MRAYLGLGSNLGRRWQQLGEAVQALALLGADLVVSPVYESAPVGGPAGQGPYLNCAVALSSELSPQELLAAGLQLEARAGRVRIERWGPRTLDVDVLAIEGIEIDSEELTVPHPRLYERAFVLAPLEHLRPELVGPDWRQRLGGPELVAQQVRQVGHLLRSADLGTPAS